MSTLSAGILLFLIMDPLGNIPLFLSLLRNVAPHRRRLVLVRELLIALAVLFIFLFGGKYLLSALQLKAESVSIAGGIVLFLIGIRMIFPPKDGIFGVDVDSEPFIVPMAIPAWLAHRPWPLSCCWQQQPSRTVDWSIALFLACWRLRSTDLATYLTMAGPQRLVALERLMACCWLPCPCRCFSWRVAYVRHIADVAATSSGIS